MKKMKTMQMNFLIAAAYTMAAIGTLSAAEFHVATNGSDTHPGTRKAPLRTIQRAAERAQSGDTITVHQGVYRERVNPPRGGKSDRKRIVYRAAPGAKVEIKGSEIVKGWSRVQGDVWKVTLPNAFFGGFNPYTNEIRGDWFTPKGRKHHTGAVYLNGDWLTEAATLEEVLLPDGRKPDWVGVANPAINPNLWFAEVDDSSTTLWAQFPGVDPNAEPVEINVIHDIHVRRLFSGAEMAGIKFHGAIDTIIRNNHIHRTCRGLWLDWMAQGTRVSGNLFHENASEDLFVEVNHGPFVRLHG